MTNRRRRSCARGECPLPRRTAIGVADGHGARGVQPGEESDPVKVRLRKALGFLAEMDLTDPDRRGCMAVNTAAELAGTDEAATALVQRMFARTEDAFRALIEEGQRSGEIAPDRDPAALGSLLLNTVVGLRLMARVAEGPDRLVRVIDATVDSL